MARTPQEPAASIIARMGGAQEVATITGRDISRVYRWMASGDKDSTHGRIPQREFAKLLATANRLHGPDHLQAGDLFDPSRLQAIHAATPSRSEEAA